MNFKRIIIVCIILLSSNAHSQIGLGIGKGALNRSSYWDTQIPNHLLIYYQGKMSNQLYFKFNSGYGLTYTEDQTLNGSEVVSKEKNTTQGFPVEFSLLYKNNLIENTINCNLVLGLGLGYYYYTTTQKTEEATFNDYRTDSGFAQYISFGLEGTIFNKSIIFIEFKKILFNNISNEIKSQSSFPNPSYDKRTESYRDTGLYDLGISLGIIF